MKFSIAAVLAVAVACVSAIPNPEPVNAEAIPAKAAWEEKRFAINKFTKRACYDTSCIGDSDCRAVGCEFCVRENWGACA